MFDNRKALPPEAQLIFYNNYRYTILEELGRGASCIVYHAFYEDLAGYRHFVRIKECFPYNIGIQRQENRELLAPPVYERMFLEAKEKFGRAYEKNVALKGMLGLVNSTVDAVNLYECHNTWYAVAACVEGRDYRQDLDEDLHSVFVRTAALVKIIKKYHDHGILHLDIKPENMLILPETKEHMVLFDFDSLLTKKELAEDASVRVSFSDGYAAPELVRGDAKKICEAADIYSIGAVVFYKLFGRTPDALDGSAAACYDFAQMNYLDQRFQPELFRELSNFLHHTIAASVTYRYCYVDEVLKQLAVLLELSDMDRPFLYQNFSYHAACFAGRAKEIEQIGRIFASGQQVLFLSGAGGIGKTELARRYAYEYASQYQKIVFVPFAGTVRKTVCGEELRVHQMEQKDEESIDDYFLRKLKLLKAVTASKDLIILDGFDVESDDDLELLLACPCRFLITSREDFRDYNYEQMDIGRMEEMGDLLQLFWNYYGEGYWQEEEETVRMIIETVDRHTMTVELIAKYLRVTDISARDLLCSLRKKEGIANMQERKVRHRKDFHFRTDSIERHLLALFDLSGFSDTECEIMRSLSLLGPVRILRSRFLWLCPADGAEEALAVLIRRGWVLYDAASDKISLHQIIQDLVYGHLQPDAGNCPHIVEKMTDYLEQELPNAVEKRIRKRLSDEFLQRISGTGLDYARLCLVYCKKIKSRMIYLNAAEQACLSFTAEDQDERMGRYKESGDLLRRIYQEQICLTGKTCADILDDGEYFKKQSVTMCSLAGKAYASAKAYSSHPSDLAASCVGLAFALDSALEDNLWIEDDRDGEPVRQMLDLAVWFFDEAQRYLLDERVPSDKKAELLQKIQGFFSGMDGKGSFYRIKHYQDLQRACDCQQMIERYREQKDMFYGGDLSAAEFAGIALENREYQRAAGIYERAWEQGKERYEDAWRHMADIYLEMGETDHAILQMQKILALDQEHILNGDAGSSYTSHVCARLIRLLMQEERMEEARKYVLELLDYHSGSAEKEGGSCHVIWMALGCCCLYKMARTDEERDGCWERFVYYYKKLPQEGLPAELAGVLLAYADRQEPAGDKIKMAFTASERISCLYKAETTPLFLDYILKVCEKEPGYRKEQILALLRYSAFWMEPENEDAQRALAYCEKAKRLYEDAGIRDAYLENLYYRMLGKWHAGCSGEYDSSKITEAKEKCDYYLLAEYEAKGKAEEVQIRIWEQAASEYHFLENYVMEEQCFGKLFGVLMPLLESSEQQKDRYCRIRFYEYAALASDQVRCYLALGDRVQVREKVWELYKRAAGYYLDMQGSKGRHQAAQECWIQIESCLDMLLAAGLQREAAVLSMAAVIIAADTDPDGKLLCDRHAYDGASLREWNTVCCKLLHGTVTDKNVEHVIAIYEKIMPILRTAGGNGPGQQFGEFEEALQWFSKTYQYRDVEFKRERTD